MVAEAKVGFFFCFSITFLTAALVDIIKHYRHYEPIRHHDLYAITFIFIITQVLLYGMKTGRSDDDRVGIRIVQTFQGGYVSTGHIGMWNEGLPHPYPVSFPQIHLLKK